MSRISTILARKSKGAFSSPRGLSVYEALEIMAANNIGALVVAEDEKYFGIMTERDYARKVILQGKHSRDTKVDEIMSTDLPTLNPGDTLERCMQLMSEHNVRYLPTFEEDRFLGVISISDVVNETIRQQKETISHLKDYLHGQ